MTAAAIFMILNGLGIAGIWTMDIVSGKKVDLSHGIFKAREEGSGSLFWPHWIAEYGTAAALIIAGAGILFDTAWAILLAPAALGALVYTSINSLGWAFAKKERYAYAVPMLVGAIGGLAALGYFFSELL